MPRASQTEPNDLKRARRAYEAFHAEQPQIWFDELSHDYQMRWVRAVRAANGAVANKPGRKVGNGKPEPIPEKDNFWQDIDTMPPKQFLKMYVPKFGKTKLKFSALPADRRAAAKRLQWRLISANKRANGTSASQ